jgi:hypothetical protein
MEAVVSVEQHLRELEGRLLRPEVRKSPGDIDALLAEDFVEFGSSGHVFDKRQTIANLRTESPVRRSFEDFKTAQLDPGVVLTTYRAIRHGVTGEQPTFSLRSSIWRLTDGRWQMLFHQGTLTEERP